MLVQSTQECLHPIGAADDSRCSRCILPKTLSTMEFSREGVCSLCAQPREARQENPSDIDGIIEELRRMGRGKPFDCLVGVSGGRDSTYLLHLLVKSHGLRCLAAYYATPFTHKAIDRQIRDIAREYGVPLMDMNISRERHARVAKDYFLQWVRTPRPELINLCCAPCKLVNREVFRIATEKHVPAIIFGGNLFEQIQFLPSARRENGRLAETFNVQARRALQIVRKGVLLLSCPTVLKHLGLGVQASLLYLNPHAPYLRIRYPGIYRADYFFHSRYNEVESSKTVASAGWKLPQGYTAEWRADCAFAELKNYMFYQITGATYNDCMLSNMIRAGDITRDEAIARLAAHPQFNELRIRESLEAMGLPLRLLALTVDDEVSCVKS